MDPKVVKSMTLVHIDLNVLFIYINKLQKEALSFSSRSESSLYLLGKALMQNFASRLLYERSLL